MRPVNRPPALRLASEPDRFALEGDEASGRRTFPTQPAVGRHDTATLESWARACWPMHLNAVLGNEIDRAVEAGVLTVPEGESLIARLAVVIDQALGVDENR
ncbi:hypothetical protein FHX44_11958 [Pseudonocardia hierapolitana]|uniref:Uncharacterized protein n=1 Tax=Pseudonocardia hierapolitana TaxID=1128676 RepID=A0A561SJR2_9PSEU|nr:hypothetical protein [Pseudonocardia hierapolitana]TWF75074.1 hypothetical protein FHX44_11958 [Pseudonocardia hierapolitana]